MDAVNYTEVRNNLKKYCDEVCEDQDAIIVTRREGRNVVLMSIDRYNMIIEKERSKQELQEQALMRVQKYYELIYGKKLDADEIAEGEEVTEE